MQRTVAVRARGFASATAASQYRIRLPSTTFPMRANAASSEPETLSAAANAALYRQQAKDTTRPKFVFHDGPPYANGAAHTGHMMNKVLKDITVRSRVAEGYSVQYIPGWDCHGMPIELRALAGLSGREREQLTPLELRARARQCAEEAMAEQTKAFQRFGMLTDFSADNVYTTMAREYEAKQLDVFRAMVASGRIFRDLQPVFWSPSSQTALAESELEYPEGHVSKAAYIAFPLSVCPPVLADYSDHIGVVAWTTTPWTIPGNVALAYARDIQYCLVDAPHGQPATSWLLAESRVSDLELALGTELRVTRRFLGDELAGAEAHHPFLPRSSPLLPGSHVTADSGSGIVHTAPAHGREDWLLVQQSDRAGSLPRPCPVDHRGCFTHDVGVDALVDLDVLAGGNEAVLDVLQQAKAVVHVHDYPHKYPYDWRTKQPVIMRATHQWFCDLTDLVPTALNALEPVTVVPASGRQRLESFVRGRDVWCVSRQRVWGVPIPAFYHRDTGEALLSDDSIEHVANVFRKHGSDAWWSLPLTELLAPAYREPGNDDAQVYRRGTDTMDVWFDSGASWSAVLDGVKADVYLEGSDQHRGWFQSSLLTRAAIDGTAPYRHLVTHGFVLDQDGRKMSKSLGNVIDPMVWINGGTERRKSGKKVQVPGIGADVMRYLIASSDYTRDVLIGKQQVAHVQVAVRKLRNSARFLLGNLDADFSATAEDAASLRPVDLFVLRRTRDAMQRVRSGMQQYDFARGTSALGSLITTDLSAFYFDLIKDSLYCDAAQHPRRRAIQLVLATVLRDLVVAAWPIVPYTAHEIIAHTPPSLLPAEPWRWTWQQGEADPLAAPDAKLDEAWADVLALRDRVNQALAQARDAKRITSAASAQVLIQTSPRVQKHLARVFASSAGDQAVLDGFAEICVVAQVLDALPADAGDSGDGDSSAWIWMQSSDLGDVAVRASPHAKCQRCWRHVVTQASQALCDRCDQVVSSLDA